MKRGRKPKNPNLLESIDPKVIKEISGLLLGALAVILILAEFGAAGSFGHSVFTGFFRAFGIIAYLFAFWLAFASVMFFEPSIIKRSRVLLWGSLAFIVLFSSLIAPFGASGGYIGTAITGVLQPVIGEVATFIILLIGCIITLLVIFNVTLTDVLKKIGTTTKNAYPNVDIDPTRVSVFKAVRRSIGGKRNAKEEAVPVAPMDGSWVAPSTDLLQEIVSKAQPGNVSKNVEVLLKTLGDFGVEVSAGKINVGPTVTQYELKPSEGVKLNTIKARADDLALALAVHPVRVEAPIPGKSAVGVEVPNKEAAIVGLRDLLENESFKKRKSNLSIPLGLDVSGELILADLKKMPHLLVAGATGSGKSVGLNAIILSLLYQNSPRDLRILLVDPKRVEFSAYNGIPHLMTPVVVDVDKTVNLLRWAVSEMERRFKLFEKVGSRDIESYNEKMNGKGVTSDDGTVHQKIPYIVLIIDELADLMAQASNEVEAAIVRLAQLARATGIHLIVATQRPSVDVITGIIKANITSRIAFSVASQIDSRTIIDQSGADKLMGNGDMLFLGGEFSKPKRIQGAFVSEKDVKSVTDFIKSEGSAIYDNSITEYREVSGIKSGRRGGGGSTGGGSDEMLEQAVQLVVETHQASASFLQRRLSVGYARAARLLDLMEERGIIGPPQGAKPRDILISSVDELGMGGDGAPDEYPKSF